MSKLVPPGLNLIADNITHKQNILGVPKAKGAEWAKELNLPKAAETIFFAGCGYQYSSELEASMSLIRGMDKSAVGTDIAFRVAQSQLGGGIAGVFRKIASKDSESGGEPLKDAVAVLTKLGIKFGYLAEDEPCCGAPLYFIGKQKDFAANAQKAYEKLKSLGVKRVISIVPSCTNALRNLFPLFIGKYDIEVKHFVEVVLENIGTKELRFPEEVKVTYHDPCQLGRYMGLIDEPRRILKAIKGIQLVETDWTKGQWATCCGGGGGFEAVFPEMSQILAVNRVKELVETGAEIIVTQCPGCIMQLKTGLKEIKNNKVKVLDLAQILAMAMGK